MIPSQMIRSIIRPIYRQIFKQELSDDINKFINNLLLMMITGAISALLIFSYNIIAGRVLGPSEYGKFAIIQSIAMFLYIPMMLGFNTAMLKYVSEKKDFESQSNVLSTVYTLILSFIVISTLIYILFFSQLSNILSLSKEQFILSVIFAIVYTLYTLTTTTLRGVFKLKTYAILQPIYSVILIVSFISLVSFNIISFKSMVYAACFSYLFIAVLIIIDLRKYFKPNFDRTIVSNLSKYSAFSLIGGISSAFYSNIDKLSINAFLNTTDLGVYMAYYVIVINIQTLIFGAFTTIFFPYASRHENKEYLFHMINKFMPYMILFGIPFIFILEYVLLKLYGSQFPFNPILAVLFSICAICIGVEGIYGWLMNSVGINGIRTTSVSAIILAIACTVLNVFLVPLIGIEGAVIAVTLSYLSSIIFTLSRRKYLYN